jgi:hypothetical protein
MEDKCQIHIWLTDTSLTEGGQTPNSQMDDKNTRLTDGWQTPDAQITDGHQTHQLTTYTRLTDVCHTLNTYTKQHQTHSYKTDNKDMIHVTDIKNQVGHKKHSRGINSRKYIKYKKRSET